MEPRHLYQLLVTGMMALAAVTLLALLVFPAPYGRHSRRNMGPSLPSRLGWILMEAPASMVFAVVFLLGSRGPELVPLVFLVMWQSHYAYRAFIYSLTLSTSSRRLPLLIAGLGFAFNCCNAFLNGIWIGSLGTYSITWLADPRFITGTLMFLAGMFINRVADGVLRRLRSTTGEGYAIPQGSLYRWISCPNYLGEIVMWTGWAVATWSTAGLAFALYTAANLLPRAVAHHRWYRRQFPDYPAHRRALIPGLL